MAKQAKKAKRGAAPPGAAKGGRSVRSSSAAADSEEPFFRPFSKLKAGSAPKTPTKSGVKSTSTGAKKAEAPPDSSAKKKPVGRAAAGPERAETARPKGADPETFAIYMAGVRALDRRATRIPRTADRLEHAAPEGATAADLDAPARAQMRALVAEGLRFESTDDGARLEGRRLDVDPREIRRLRRGMYAVEGKLDLHGMSLEEAREAVTAFVRKRSAQGDRVVAIIHGKGTHTPGGFGVLRGEIGAWLSQKSAARHVEAFATAPVDQGGAGALLVLLARSFGRGNPR